MQKSYTLWQRLSSATPLFFRRVQALALGLAGLGGTLATIHSIPATLTTSLISVGTAIAAIAQFAVKEFTPLPPPNGGEAKTEGGVSNETK